MERAELRLGSGVWPGVEQERFRFGDLSVGVGGGGLFGGEVGGGRLRFSGAGGKALCKSAGERGDGMPYPRPMDSLSDRFMTGRSGASWCIGFSFSLGVERAPRSLGLGFPGLAAGPMFLIGHLSVTTCRTVVGISMLVRYVSMLVLCVG